MKRKILKVFVIIFAIIGVSIVGRIVKAEHTYKKNFFSNNRNEPYSQGVPLDQMDFSVYRRYMIQYSTALASNYKREIVLPCDVDYYSHKEDKTPALTLKKGTTVYICPVNESFKEGYGIICWPDYDSKWRYGHPLSVTDSEHLPSEFTGYYVKESQLKKVAKAFYRVNLRQLRTKHSFIASEYADLVMDVNVDQLLYKGGVFCPPYTIKLSDFPLIRKILYFIIGVYVQLSR